MAARGAAERMASQLAEDCGQTVGYNVRFDRCVGPSTRLEVVTEGILTRRLQLDPELNGVGLVIFDEFHERNLNSDLGLALCLQTRALFRPDLKLMVMSATLDSEALTRVLPSAPILQSEGRSYPVTEHFLPRSPGYLSGKHLCDALKALVLQALADNSGHILVFLPGRGEIQALQRALQSSLSDDWRVLPMHGGLSLDEQRRAIAPVEDGIRKLVLSTDIAETSLTIEGVSVVVDSGLCRVPVFDLKTGITRLATQKISRSSATQRAGRAGRLAEGHCYRLWTREEHASLVPQRTPEILSQDLSGLLLQCISWGIDDPQELDWVDVPSPAALAQARQVLEQLKLLEGGRLSERGKNAAQLPLAPRLASLLVMGLEAGHADTVAKAAAILSETRSNGSDNLLDLLRSIDERGADPHWRKRILLSTKQYLALIKKLAIDEPAETEPLLCSLARAFPEFIAQRRKDSDGQYLLASGRAAKLKPGTALASSEYLVVCELGGRDGQSEDQIFLALPIEKELLINALTDLQINKTVCEWSNQNFIAERQQCIGALVLRRRVIQELSDSEVKSAWLDYIRRHGIEILPWSDELRTLQARVILAHSEFGKPWPDFSDGALLAAADQWLSEFLPKQMNMNAFKKIDLRAALLSQLPWPLPSELDALLPLRWRVASGSNVEINYGLNPPALEVKLQEMFGCDETPTLMKGRLPMQVHLLSPARRPLQITQDLKNFWRGSYHAIKKEMKGRYPKHPWPDEPWNAEASRLTKNALNTKTQK